MQRMTYRPISLVHGSGELPYGTCLPSGLATLGRQPSSLSRGILRGVRVSGCERAKLRARWLINPANLNVFVWTPIPIAPSRAHLRSFFFQRQSRSRARFYLSFAMRENIISNSNQRMYIFVSFVNNNANNYYNLEKSWYENCIQHANKHQTLSTKG